MISTTVYLIIEPKHDWQGRLTGISVDRAVKTKPHRLSPRFVAIALNVEVDETLFQQFLPEATIAIRDTRDVLTPTVEVIQPPEDTDVSDVMDDGAEEGPE